MKTKLLVSIGVALALSMTSLGCKQGEDTAADQPSDDGGGGSGGGGGGGGGGTTPVCEYAGSSSGFYAAQNGVYIPDLAAGTTVKTITMYFAGSVIGNHTLQAEALECGFQGTSRGTATASITSMQSGSSYKAATFSFSSPITVANCSGGMGAVAFKFTVVSGSSNTSDLKFATQYASGTSCTIKTASDITSATPSHQSTWMATGSYTNN